MKDIKVIIDELDKLIERMIITKNKIKLWQLNKDLFNDQNKVEIIDSFIFRFSKIQDTIGNKLFPGILMVLEDSYLSLGNRYFT